MCIRDSHHSQATFPGFIHEISEIRDGSANKKLKSDACSFDGLDSIDFIRILGLPFQDMQAFDREMVKRADGARLAEAFNQAMPELPARLKNELI